MSAASKIRNHALYIALIILLVLIIFIPELRHINEVTGFAFNDRVSYRTKMDITKISIEEFHDYIPLWNPFFMSGAPFFSKPGMDIGFFFITYPLLMFLPLTVAMNLSYILVIMLAGISMYTLMCYLKLEKRYALLSAIIYMFNGWVFTRLRWGHLTTLAPHAITPLIILFLIKALKEKHWVKNSIIVGVLCAIQVHAGPDLKVTLWVIPILTLYALFKLIEKPTLNQAVKTIIIGLLVVSVTFGLTAVKILPALSYLEVGSRATIQFSQAISQRVEWKNIFQNLIEPVPPAIFNTGVHYNIGIIAFLVGLLAIFKKIKNKMVLYFTSIIFLAVLLGTGSFLFYLFWKYVPFYGSFRYPSRILSIYILAMAALVGIGASVLDHLLKKKFNLSSRATTIFFIILTILILINNVIFGMTPRLFNEWINQDKALEENEILQHISNQTGIFRMHVYETNGIDWATDFQNVPLGIQTLYGYDSAWLVDYMNIYLSVAFRNPAKFWGILNTKYVTSETELNISGLNLVRKFPECSECLVNEGKYKKALGPYLYENALFLPRAYIVPNSILIVGKDENVKQLVYGLMLDPMFNPSNTVIIQGKESINGHTQEELQRYNAIFLTQGSADQSSIFKLQNYVGTGGILMPDITKGEQTVSNEKMQEMWSSLKGNITIIDDNDHQFESFDQGRLNIRGAQGYLVYSEILTHYPGWSAKVDGRIAEIQRADGVIGAIYLEGPSQELVLTFKPKSFVMGAFITIVSIILLLGLLILEFIKKRRHNVQIEQSQSLSQ